MSRLGVVGPKEIPRGRFGCISPLSEPDELKEEAMNTLKIFRSYLLVCRLIVLLQPLRGLAQQSANASRTTSDRDGQHDFDFDIVPWKTHLSRLENPLTGSTAWIQYEGTSVVRKIWNG